MLGALLATVGAERTLAQCEPQWLPGKGMTGPAGQIYCAAMWDPDGPGPKAAVLVVGGTFERIGGAVAFNIAMWDGESWSKLPGTANGTDSVVYCLLPLANGDLIVGGNFRFAGGVFSQKLALFRGSSWLKISSNLDDGSSSSYGVRAVLALPTGELLVGGSFRVSGLNDVYNLAKWNGSSWSAVAPSPSGEVRALAVLPGGDIAVGGFFQTVGVMSANGVARLSAGGWYSYGVGPGSTPAYVHALVTLPDGKLIAGGSFTNRADSKPSNIALWNGTTWTRIGGGLDGPVFHLQTLPDGNLLAGGTFATGSGLTLNNIAKWDGVNWSAMSGGIMISPTSEAVSRCAVQMPGNEIFVGGKFDTAGDAGVTSCARWKDSTWSAMGSGLSGWYSRQVNALCPLPDGEMIVGGLFTGADGRVVNRIARWSSGRYSPLGTGFTSASYYASVAAIVRTPNGDIVAGGNFERAGGVPAVAIARWNGSVWAPMGTLLTSVSALAALPTGEVVASGNFNGSGGIRKWNGQSWEKMGNLLGGVNAMSVDAQGDLIVAGTLSGLGLTSGQHVARWNGVTWIELGSGFNSAIKALASLTDGAIVAGGNFTVVDGVSAPGVARWDGNRWIPLGALRGTPDVRSLGLMPSGHVVAGGTFYDMAGTPANNIAWWTGSAWSPLGAGLGGQLEYVRAIAASTTGELHVGGYFFGSENMSSHCHARWTSLPNPQISDQPSSLQVNGGQTAEFYATPAFGFAELPGALTFTWRHNGFPISEVGASGTLVKTGPTILHITNVNRDHAGIYDVVFANECDSVVSEPAALTVVKAHITDINADGQVDDADFLLFLDQYDLMLCIDTLMPDSCSADFNQDGFVDDADFAIFVPTYHAMLF